MILVGRITHDPELKATTSGTEIVNFQLAVNRYGRDKQADFFRIVCFGKSAEFVSTYVKKGTLLLVEGALRNNVWEDSMGQKRNTMEIIANRVEIMEKKGSSAPFEETEGDIDENSESEDIPEINDGEDLEGDDSDEIPF